MTRTIAEIAQALGVEAIGDAGFIVTGLSDPQLAKSDELALAMSPRFEQVLIQNDQIKAAVIWDGADWQALGLEAALTVPRARLAMAQLTTCFAVPQVHQGIHPLADVSAKAEIASNVAIGAFVSIAEGAVIGANTVLHPGVRIGAGVHIGENVICQPNVVIGADGFSFVTQTPSHPETGRKTLGRMAFQPMDGTLHKIHSLGSVIIGDDVEIGANSTVDAGTVRPTLVAAGTKIDNLVQVGHNVQIGRDCVLCAQAAVGGSAMIGDRVVLGGKSGVGDNLTVGSDVVVGGAAAVLSDIPDGRFVMGYPAIPLTEHRAQQRALKRSTKGGFQTNPE